MTDEQQSLMTEQQQRFETRAVHAGEHAPPGEFIPIATPIHVGASYLYRDLEQLYAVTMGEREGYVYTRYGNPTVGAMEAAVAELEGTEAAFGLASGMAAIHTAFLAAGLQAGDRVVASRDIYGSAFTLLNGLLRRFGVETTFVDIADLTAVESVIARTRPRLVHFELISNPLVRVADGPAIVRLAKAAGAVVTIDNTFATPYLATPAAWGADMVIHSSTKYLGGHGDVVAGVVACSAQTRAALWDIGIQTGGILGAFEGWLVLRSVKTLPLRMARQCANAMAVARLLQGHPAVRRVHYPGLEEHPQHRLAATLLRSGLFGAMLSFELREGTRDAALRFLQALQTVLPTQSLGDIYSSALIPALSSHHMLSPDERAAIGVGDGVIRFSAGIEDADDLVRDVARALDRCGGA
jgi:cystathionine gamma-synthase/methionine-gamma-lyase